MTSNFIGFLLPLAFLSLISCNKDTISPQPPPAEEKPIIELGRMSFLKNGKKLDFPMNGKYIVWDEKKGFKGTFLFFEYFPENLLKENIYFYDFPEKVGKYSFEYSGYQTQGNNIPGNIIEWLYDGDQNLGNLNVDTTRTDNWVEIIKYDSEKRIMEGRFEVHLIDSDDVVPPFMPQKIDLTEGKFHVQIKQ